MTKTKMGNINVHVTSPLDRYAYGREGNQIQIVDRNDNEAFVMNLSAAKASQVYHLLQTTHPNRDIGKIEFETSNGPRTVQELIHTAPDGTLKAKLGLI